MRCPAVLPLGLMAVFCSLITTAPSRAQSSASPKFCFPPPSATEPDVPQRKVIVDHVEFDKPIHLSTDEVAQIVSDANQLEMDAEFPGWVDSFAEIGLRSAWQNRGYFRAAFSARAKSLGVDSDSERFLVNVHVENEGPQFHVGSIQFVGGTVFQEWELRDAFPVREGEIFSVQSVREGLSALTKLYGARGYLDFTAVPETEIDDNLQRVLLVMYLNEQKQFRVGKLEIDGHDANLDALLQSMIKPGEPFDYLALERFSKDNQSILPSRFLDRMEARRNVRTGIVDISFDLRACPKPSAAEAVDHVGH